MPASNRTSTEDSEERSMTRVALVFAIVATATIPAVSTQAIAQPDKPKPAFDATGWTLLGSQTVDRARDRDVIAVGKYQGRFDKLTLVVVDSDLELADMTIVFGNGDRWSPKLRHAFKEGSRSRAIDLPGDNRAIAKIELAYANTKGGGKARVEVYGKDSKANNPNPTPDVAKPIGPVTWDSAGWVRLGSKKVGGKRDRDVLRVGKYAGKFDQLTFVVHDSDLELLEFTITFGNGQKWAPALRHHFKEGSRTHVIDLPGNDRFIRSIELKYANLAGGGAARAEVWGRASGRKYEPKPKPVTWERGGWTLIGRAAVDGWRDRDRIKALSGKPFSELMFAVGGSSVEIFDIEVTLGNGETFKPPARLMFKDGPRTLPVDIPGALRKIKFIDVKYANLPGGGRAYLEVWARKKPTTVPPPTGTISPK
jgi:hypothetical protein